MNNREFEEFFNLRLNQLSLLGGLGPGQATKLIKLAIRIGLADLWHSNAWTFRRKECEIDTSSSAEQYELPDDCCAIMVPREKSSTYGSGLIYVTKDEFDRRVPRPTSHTGGTPQLCTMYTDKVQKKWIQFFPPPNVSPVYLPYLADTPSGVDKVPNIARAALIATISKYLYEPGSIKYQAADISADKEIAKLEVRDSPYAEDLWRFFDDTDRQVGYTEDWNWQ